MRTPSFMRLASIDRSHFIVGCRHGMVHLTWERTTIRFSRDEFGCLVHLLRQVKSGPAPRRIQDGEVQLTWRDDEDSEARVGATVLLFAPGEFQAFAHLCSQAMERLEQILALGTWDPDPSDEGPPDLLARFRPDSFSRN